MGLWRQGDGQWLRRFSREPEFPCRSAPRRSPSSSSCILSPFGRRSEESGIQYKGRDCGRLDSSCIKGRIGVQHNYAILRNNDTGNGEADSVRGKRLCSSLVDPQQKLFARFRCGKSKDMFVCNCDFEKDKIRWDLRSIQVDENFNHRKGGVFGSIEGGNPSPVPPAPRSLSAIASQFRILLAA